MKSELINALHKKREPLLAPLYFCTISPKLKEMFSNNILMENVVLTRIIHKGFVMKSSG